jgi:hypothetical protein
MFTWLLSTILHHANRSTKSDRFYAIKNRILDRFGRIVGYDIQHIPGKKCFTCGGRGIYVGYYWESGDEWQDTCNRCWGNGWYKDPQWNILELKSFGKFRFHKPIERFRSLKKLNAYCDDKGIDQARPIDGYIDHRYSRYGNWAVLILHIVYERRFPPIDVGFGLGWPCYWWKFQNWPAAICHIAWRRANAMPFMDLRKKWASPKQISPVPSEFYGSVYQSDDEFPF